MQGPGLFRTLVMTELSATVQPGVIYLPPPPPTKDDEASIPMEDDEASIPMENDEASIPTEDVRNGTYVNAGIRKAAKRTLPWDLSAEEIQLASPPPSPQDEDIHEAKRPRLETPFPASADEAPTTNTSHTTTVAVLQDEVLYSKGVHLQIALPAAAAAADCDPMMDIHQKLSATGATRRWTPEEDVILTNSVTNTRKKKCGQGYTADWVAISALVPGRTKGQCRYRWRGTVDPSNHRTTVRPGRWTADEDKKIKDVVRAHGANSWKTITELVPGRTKRQCYLRWHHVLDPSIDRSLARAGKWTADEDKELMDVVRVHGANNWKAIATLIPGRTGCQCNDRWRDKLDPSIGRPTARFVRWTADEDKMLKEAVHTHGGQCWEAIAELVPARTKKQCCYRWNAVKDK